MNVGTAQLEYVYGQIVILTKLVPWVPLGTGWRPAVGMARLHLDYETFYRMAGRPDLAEERARRQAVVKPLWLSGLVAFAVGLTSMIVGEDRSGGVFLIGGLSLAGLGIVLMNVGNLYGRESISEGEALRLAHAYNVALHRRLGLAGEPPFMGAQSARTRPRPRLAPAFVLGLGRAALGLAATF